MESIERVFRTIERSRKVSGPNVIGTAAVGNKIIEIDGRTETMRQRTAKQSAK